MSNNRIDTLTMTIPEVAKALGISRGLAYELANRDELPVKVIRLGEKRMVVPKRAFENILSGNQGEG
ncbi:helix-turn-helix transcriptional regulator [Chloroflexota bacterium]